ncbi:hypothetical protein EOD39_13130 [Acipenser ruthenus]|uniref:Uncharacterized protein n=1 Tax=Acipenser ruthenus TaxID=7906 RepID=A0A662YNZ0_ACIRT|nr:hypothetical protein EOD39_13130 [Acipenser ruthenus]
MLPTEERTPVYDQAKKLLATFKPAPSALANNAACEENTVKGTLEKEYGAKEMGFKKQKIEVEFTEWEDKIEDCDKKTRSSDT